MDQKDLLDLAALVDSGKATPAFLADCKVGWELASDWRSIQQAAKDGGIADWRIKNKLQTYLGSFVPTITLPHATIIYVPALCSLFPEACFYKDTE